ncbi:response regulator transcription factor [Shimazuella sp. AN120528]|uniref:response regulator transcription factor n=1 Tax=Shimazuella soli TaxID=1892854 RepID=UPI001F0EB6E0|nr:response regulator transcription factor [Shimazuella soli]MCH5586649.1 response regulator transcription factor [Shimazuella soli]
MQNVLIVDDEDKIRDVLASYLGQAGFKTLEAVNGKEALHIVHEVQLDFVILDLMLPDVSGEIICQQIRALSPIPILMLTAKVSESDRITGLSIGADDYVIKPFSPKEVVARVKAILRRSKHDLLTNKVVFRDGELVIDVGKQMVLKHGKEVHLTPGEFKLLVVLARHPNRPFSREELIGKVFGFDYEGDDRIIDQHVKNLRHKIEDSPKKPRYLTTVYGLGYRFMGR